MCFKQNVLNQAYFAALVLSLDGVVSALAYYVLLVNTEETNGARLPFLCNIAKIF